MDLKDEILEDAREHSALLYANLTRQFSDDFNSANNMKDHKIKILVWLSALSATQISIIHQIFPKTAHKELAQTFAEGLMELYKED